MEAHGGLELFESVTTIAACLTRLDGFVPRTKGLGRLSEPSRIVADLSAGVVKLSDFPRSGESAEYLKEGVVRTPGGECRDPRSLFSGLKKYGRWSQKEACYFFGYALMHYWTLPFSLREAALLAHDDSKRRLTVRFAPERHTHSAVESFVFDEHGLLRRHDYTADIIGRFATGAHYSRNYRDVSGLQVAGTRDVRLRVGSWSLGVRVLIGELEDFDVERSGGKASSSRCGSDEPDVEHVL